MYAGCDVELYRFFADNSMHYYRCFGTMPPHLELLRANIGFFIAQEPVVRSRVLAYERELAELVKNRETREALCAKNTNSE